MKKGNKNKKSIIKNKQESINQKDSKTKFKKFLLHPFFICVVIFALVIFFITFTLLFNDKEVNKNEVKKPSNEIKKDPTAINTPSIPNPPSEEAVQETKPREIIIYNFSDINVSGAKSLHDKNQTIFIDFSVESMYITGHIKGSKNIPLEKIDISIESLDKNKEYIVYARQNSISVEGAKKIASLGFPNIKRLNGNYGYWVLQGYPVERSY